MEIENILRNRVENYFDGLKNNFEDTIKTKQDGDINLKRGQLIEKEIKRIENILNGNGDIANFEKLNRDISISIEVNKVRGKLRDKRSTIRDAYKNGTRNLDLNIEKDLDIFAWARAYEDFLIYLKAKLPQNEYDNLYEKMINKYIADVDKTDFKETIIYKRLSNFKDKINWIQNNKADAYRFSNHIDFTIKQMNDCFTFPFGKLKKHDQPGNKRTQTELTKIFKELGLKK